MSPIPPHSGRVRILALGLLCIPASLTAQGTLSDYERADSFNVRTRGLVVGVAGGPNWIGESSRFWYRTSVTGGNEFVLVDPSARSKGAAFDHERMASAINAARDDSVSAVMLPFNEFEYTEDGGGHRVRIG